MVAAAASATTDDRTRRELIKAWQAINRATPTATSLGVEVAPGDAAQLRLAVTEPVAAAGVEQRTERPAAAWSEPAAAPAESTAELSAWLGGASRVLMAARIADAPNHARVQALLVQAIELAAQISRTIAAQQDATAAQRRAAAATAQALQTATAPGRPAGWQFSKSGTEVIESARNARGSAAAAEMDVSRTPGPAPGVEPNEPGR